MGSNVSLEGIGSKDDPGGHPGPMLSLIDKLKPSPGGSLHCPLLHSHHQQNKKPYDGAVENTPAWGLDVD